MSFRFRRTLRIAPGVRLNFSRSGVSTSIGGRGATMTLSRRGTYANLGVPGTGLSWRGRIDGGKGRSDKRVASNAPKPRAVAPTSGTDALDRAHMLADQRSGVRDGFQASNRTLDGDLLVVGPTAPRQSRARFGRLRFGVIALLLGAAAFGALWAHDAGPGPGAFSDDALLVSLLILGGAAAFVIAARSRDIGITPWVTFAGIGLALWLFPMALVLVCAGLLFLPTEAMV